MALYRLATSLDSLYGFIGLSAGIPATTNQTNSEQHSPDTTQPVLHD